MCVRLLVWSEPSTLRVPRVSIGHIYNAALIEDYGSYKGRSALLLHGIPAAIK